jgi:hypothetical protein
MNMKMMDAAPEDLQAAKHRLEGQIIVEEAAKRGMRLELDLVLKVTARGKKVDLDFLEEYGKTGDSNDYLKALLGKLLAPENEIAVGKTHNGIKRVLKVLDEALKRDDLLQHINVTLVKQLVDSSAKFLAAIEK